MGDQTCGPVSTKRQTLRKLLQEITPAASVSSIQEFVLLVRELSDAWQKEDWLARECDAEFLLNNARIVGGIWFRGHADTNLSLRPGLYRDSLFKDIQKQDDSPKPDEELEAHRFSELFDLEHDMRIDFKSYGHLLNEANEAVTAMDWYFMMQHHGVPTRLLDWTTNALAALFFAIEGFKKRHQSANQQVVDSSDADNEVSIWMMDAYWLANHLSDTWYAPLLPWSEDSGAYLPSLETMIDKLEDAKALLPEYAMPIEPSAIHPRVAAQEGRFVIFGKTQELLLHKLRLESIGDSKLEQLRLRQIQFKIQDPEDVLRTLAGLGVSRRTLFPDFGGLAEFVSWKHLHRVRPYLATSD